MITVQYLESVALYRSQNDLVMDMLSEITQAPLHEVCIRMRYFPNIRQCSHIDIAGTIDWHRFHLTLLNHRAYSLQVIRYITVVDTRHWTGAQEYWEGLIRAHLPLLYSCGLFAFTSAEDNRPSFWA